MEFKIGDKVTFKSKEIFKETTTNWNNREFKWNSIFVIKGYQYFETLNRYYYSLDYNGIEIRRWGYNLKKHQPFKIITLRKKTYE